VYSCYGLERQATITGSFSDHLCYRLHVCRYIAQQKCNRTAAGVRCADTVSAKSQAMTPIHILAVIAWLVIMTLAGIGAHQQRMKLKTRPSDGAALCAMDPPTLSAKMYERMPDAPGVVRCSMSCTTDVGCKHFNYISTESNPCQLYHYRPTNFDVAQNCQHYYKRGLIYVVIYIVRPHSHTNRSFPSQRPKAQ